LFVFHSSIKAHWKLPQDKTLNAARGKFRFSREKVKTKTKTGTETKK
jgi:hypothetical protein